MSQSREAAWLPARHWGSRRKLQRAGRWAADPAALAAVAVVSLALHK